MLLHEDMGSPPFARIRKIWQLMEEGEITLAGNKRLKIYGTLRCASGIRMKSSNRVFFSSAREAEVYGYRPCGHCMKAAYDQWKIKQS